VPKAKWSWRTNFHPSQPASWRSLYQRLVYPWGRAGLQQHARSTARAAAPVEVFRDPVRSVRAFNEACPGRRSQGTTMIGPTACDGVVRCVNAPRAGHIFAESRWLDRCSKRPDPAPPCKLHRLPSQLLGAIAKVAQARLRLMPPVCKWLTDLHWAMLVCEKGPTAQGRPLRSHPNSNQEKRKP
jgi:hypothetical protein